MDFLKLSQFLATACIKNSEQLRTNKKKFQLVSLGPTTCTEFHIDMEKLNVLNTFGSAILR